MVNVARKTISHAAIYGLGDILRQAVSFLMLPIYTRFLTPADYGVVELFSLMVGTLQVLVGTSKGQGVIRYYFAAEEDRGRRQLMSTAFFIRMLSAGIACLLLVLFADQASYVLFGEYSYSGLLALFAVILVTQSAEEFGLLYVRVHQRPGIFFVISMVKLILQVLLNLYFVVWKEMHVEGVIYSAVLASSVVGLFCAGYTFSYSGVNVCVRIARKLFVFSYPLWFSSLGVFYITFGDRYFLRIFSDLTQVGIYALAYRFGFLLVLLTWSPFVKIWGTQRYEIYKEPNAIEIYQRVFLYFAVYQSFVGLGIALYVKDVLTVMADPQFLDAYKTVPIIILAYILQSMMVFNNFSLLVKDKTSYIAYGSVITVIVITIAYLTLIPSYKTYGAAWATALAFAVQLTWIQHHGRKYYDMRLPWKKVFLVLSMATAIYLVSLAIPELMMWSTILKAMLLILFLVLLMLLPILPKEDKQRIGSLIRQPGRFAGLLKESV